MPAAITFAQVSKQFSLHERARSFQEVLVGFFGGGLNGRRRGEVPDALRGRFWALQDVTFEVGKGETVGLIGPNGTGKSTVLKMIAGIIEPDSGRVEVHGRVGALLELGAGFHPDLSGRENIYLNGSVLGLRRVEIESKLDDIIAFAELERFVDMPVKHYSSGMQMRLGFAIAAHIDPDILLVDEVLAVGDEAFQKKCIERIEEFEMEGCTILFVSHNLQLVQHICDKALWLEGGQVHQVGPADRVVAAYTGRVNETLEGKLNLQNNRARLSDRLEGFHICNVRMIDGEGHPCWTFNSGDSVLIEIEYESDERVEEPVFSLLIHRADGLYVSSTNTHNIDPLEIPPIKGRGKVSVIIDSLNLHQGYYFLSVGAYFRPDPPYWSSEADFLDKVLRFRMLSDGRHGVLSLDATWGFESDTLRTE